MMSDSDVVVKKSWKDGYGVVLLTLVVFLGLWEGIVQGFEIPKIIFPAPSMVLVSLFDGIATGLYVEHFLVTFYEIVAGFAIGSAGGLLLGVLIGQSLFLEKILYPYVVAFQTIPKVAVAPIFVIWFGYGLSSKIIITATIAFFPLLANTIVGLRSAPRDQIELMVAFTATRWQTFRMVRFPHALPFVFVGLDVAAVLSVIGAIVGEFVGSQAGLGYLILQMNYNFDMPGIFAVLIILSLIGVGLHLLVVWVQGIVVFWVDKEGNRVMGA
ncbi:MAG: ABC transporter permease [Alphaproteobacteria bacterium]|nr:ABC transporter permease [Alphaproteobacteria bacterium]